MFSCFFTVKRKISEKKNARTYRFAHSRISTRKSFHACPRVLTRVSETEGTCVRFARTRPHARTRRRVGYTLTPGSLRSAHAIPQCEKPFFPPRMLGRTHARARTVDEDDASSSEFTRTGELPPRLKILSVGACWSEESITREAVHSAPSPDCRSRE